MSEDEKKALELIIEALQSSIAWNETFGLHNITNLLNKTEEAKKLLKIKKKMKTAQ